MQRSVRVFALIGAVALALSTAACSSAGALNLKLPAQVSGSLPKDTQTQLQSAVQQAMTASGSPGAIVGVWVPWAGSWVSGMGKTTAKGAAVTPDMTFRAGGVTKSMTCDALYAMAAKGKVSLTDKVSKWVTNAPEYTKATLADLCNGTAGLQSYEPELLNSMLSNPTRDWSPRELAAYGLAQSSPVAPGQSFVDSDTSYVLLGLALEKASGMSASEVLSTYVFTPLGLHSTALHLSEKAPTPTLTGLRSGDKQGGGVDCAAPADLTDLSETAGYTASGVVSTVQDLGRYTQALATGASPFATKDRFAKPLTAWDGAPSWLTATGGDYQAGSLVGQFSAFPGYLVGAFADRDTGLTVVVVLNNSRAGTAISSNLVWELAAIASKTPAAKGQKAQQAGLPFTPEDRSAEIVKAAVCPMQ